jgi:hypothetical protein
VRVAHRVLASWARARSALPVASADATRRHRTAPVDGARGVPAPGSRATHRAGRTWPPGSAHVPLFEHPEGVADGVVAAADVQTLDAPERSVSMANLPRAATLFPGRTMALDAGKTTGGK